MESTWRITAREVIARVLAQTHGQPTKERLKAIREAYPFHSRRMHPYRMWLKEQKLAMRLLTNDFLTEPLPKKKAPQEIPGQLSLFEGQDDN